MPRTRRYSLFYQPTGDGRATARAGRVARAHATTLFFWRLSGTFTGPRFVRAYYYPDMGTNFWQFVRAFTGRWFIAMSGPLSVPLAILGVLVPNWPLRVVLLATAGACFVFAAYWVWRNERAARIELEQRLAQIAAKPRLKCFFDVKDAGCYRPNTIAYQVDRSTGNVTGQATCDWYRIRADAEGGNIPNCQACLISVERDGVSVFSGDAPPLVIAHHGELPTTIHQGVPKYVDLLAIYENNRVDTAVSSERRTSSTDWDNMFSQPGEYRIRAAVVSPEAETALIAVTLKWTMDRTTSEIR